MKIGVFWRSFRNVEFQRKLTPDNVKDNAYEEAYLHSESLKEAGFKTELIEWKDNPLEVYEKILEEKIDLVFNASSTEELSFLETFNIPYTGSSIYTVVMDKATRKIILSYYGITTPKFLLAKSKDSIPHIKLKYPIFVKPVEGRGSGGIDESNIISSYDQLPKVVEKITEGIGQLALIEEFIQGREISVGIIGYENPEVLPILEVQYNDSKTNTYEHKMFDKEIIICPVKLDKKIEDEIKKISLEIYKILDIKDFGRIDFILDKDNVPYFLEINTFAGLTSPGEEEEANVNCGYMGYMARAKGYSRSEFLKNIVQSTMDRYKVDISI